MKVVILGAPSDSGNRGVLALAASLSRLVLNANPDAQITLLDGQIKTVPFTFLHAGERRVLPVVGWRLSPRAPMRDQLTWIFLMAIVYRLVPALRRSIAARFPWIDALSRCDVAGDIRGGDSFSDIYGMRRFLLASLAASTVLILKKPLVQFPQTYGPFKSARARSVAKFLLRRSRMIAARDVRSQAAARTLADGSREVLLTPDVAFALEVVRPAHIELDSPSPMSGESVIGINVNGLLFNGGYDGSNMFGLRLDYREFLLRMVVALLRCDTRSSIWLVPHTYAPEASVESDNGSCRTLKGLLDEESRNRVRVVSAEYDQHEIKGVISSCEFFVGSRMHACIAALSQGIPTVGVAYSRKFAGVFESVGMEDWVIDARDVETDAAVARVVELFGDRDAVRPGLKTRTEAAKADLAAKFQQILTAVTA